MVVNEDKRQEQSDGRLGDWPGLAANKLRQCQHLRPVAMGVYRRSRVESLGKERNTKQSSVYSDRPPQRKKKKRQMQELLVGGTRRKKAPHREEMSKKMNADVVGTAAQIAIWPDPPPGQVNDIERKTEWFDSMESICDASMLRVHRYARDAVY